MSRLVLLLAAVLVLLVMVGGAGADAYCRFQYTEATHGFGTFSSSDCWAYPSQGEALCWGANKGTGNYEVYYSGVITFCNGSCSRLAMVESTTTKQFLVGNVGDSISGHYTSGRHPTINIWQKGKNYFSYACGVWSTQSWTITISETLIDEYTVSGTMACTDVELYHKDSFGTYTMIGYSNTSSYNFDILDGHDYMLLFVNGAHYFTCTGNEVFNNDACLWVYGYTCGIDSIKLYVDDSGSWVLDDTESQDTGYDVYEMLIVDGEDYKISFIDSTIDGDIVVHNQTFSCTGDHVMIDFDRCEWIYPPYPPAPPIPIYIWTGYDYNIVVFRDEHGNFIENSQLAIYDKTDSQYLQRWTDAADGYTLLGTRFNTDHDVLLSLRTFDGVFTLDTTFPANGSAPVGEENITTTNWTIPIKYNLNVLPVDQYGASLFDVFCGLSEYTPLNPAAFWGMDLSDRGYVAVTNCSGFAMCDIIAEKEGYADYKVEALNWTSKSALVKDYRHNIVMEEE